MDRGGFDDYYKEEVVPEQVKKFVKTFHKHIHNRDVTEIHNCYDEGFKKIKTQYYAVSSWPSAEAIADIVQYDETFIVLYREMYYRHKYSHLRSTDLTDSLDSFQNYIDLFNILLGQNDKRPQIDLPNQWIWDIIDQFINQFQHFSRFKTKLHNASSHDIKILKENKHVWSAQTVLRYLHALASKGHVYVQHNKPMPALEEFDDPVSNIAGMMAYFSVVGLMRVHCISGDYLTALKVLDSVDLRKRSALSKLYSCHVTTYYHMAFCYMMTKRYTDASKTLVSVLQYNPRRGPDETRTPVKHHMNSDQLYILLEKAGTMNIPAMIERMRALLAILHCICPQQKRLDPVLVESLKDCCRDEIQWTRLQTGDESAAESLFAQGCPIFISLAPPDLGSSVNTELKAYKQQLDVFIETLKARKHITKVHDVVKLYSSIPVEKLAKTVGVDEDALISLLSSTKNKTRSLRWVGGPPMQGQWQPSHAVDFYVEKGTVHVAELKAPRRYAEDFMSNVNKLEDLIRDVKRISL